MTLTPPPVVRAFMTHEMGDIEIAALATGRNEEFDRIIDAIERSRSAAPGSLQHIALYGSRGFGKSFMTRRVQIATASMGGKKGPVHYVLLAEEQHNLQRNPHEFLDLIAEHLKELRGALLDPDAAFRATMFQWPQPGEEMRRWDEAAARLEAEIDAILDKKPGLVIVVVENFDALLATLFKDDEDEQRLRQWLDRHSNRLMLFATATGTVDIYYDRPLFHAFESVRLSPWTQDECIEYFNRLRKLEQRPDLSAAEEAKARAIAEFIGGTPRLAHLLAEVIDTGEALTVAETMSALADRLAEYYRRRIEDLPQLSRGLLDALIRGGEPASQTELAERVGAKGQNIIARTMADLERADVIRGKRAPSGRHKLYSVTDRVFVHYYRLRQGSQVARNTPLASILDFLRSFYSRDEKFKQALKHLEAGQPIEAGLFGLLANEGFERLGNHFIDRFMQRAPLYVAGLPAETRESLLRVARLLKDEPAQSHHECHSLTNSERRSDAICAVIRAQALYRLLNEDTKAREAILAELVSAEGDSAALLNCELFLLEGPASEIGKAAIARIDDVTKIADLGIRVVAGTIVAQEARKNGNQEEAIRVGATLPEICQANGWKVSETLLLRTLIEAYAELERFPEAIAACNRACNLMIERGKNGLAFSMFTRNAALHGKIERNEEAANWARKALDLPYEDEQAQVRAAIHAFLGNIARLEKRWKDADHEFAAAIAFAPLLKDAPAMADWLRMRAEALLELDEPENAYELAMQAYQRLASVEDKSSRLNILMVLLASLNDSGRISDVNRYANEALILATESGSRKAEINIRSRLAGAFAQSSDFESAWNALAPAVELCRQKDDIGLLSPILFMRAAIGMAGYNKSAIDDFVEALDILGRNERIFAEFGSIIWFSEFFVTCALNGAFDVLDETIEKHGNLLIETMDSFSFTRENGRHLARYARAKGRAAGYAVIEGILLRIEAFYRRLPREKYDKVWLTNLVSGFAEDCRDPGLLRDVSTLLNTMFHPSNSVSGSMLEALASFDEAQHPEEKLAEFDPDIATLVRRFRGVKSSGEEPREKDPRRKRRGR